MSRRAALALAACLTGPSLVLLAGCAAGSSGTQAEAHAAPSSAHPFDTLRSLAERPSSTRPEITPPDASLAELSHDDPAWPRATMPLADLQVSEFVAAEQPPAAQSPTEPGQITKALTLYARARQLTAAGDPTAAIGLLEKATELDPSAPELWRALGDARRAALFENSAGGAFAKAADLGLDEPEALTLAGLHAATQGEHRRAAGDLLRAVRSRPAHADPLIDFVAHAALGESLLDLGYTRAGAEALSVGVRLPRAARVPTGVGREAADLQRNRATLLVRTGDAYASLGEYASAAEAYTQASSVPGAQPVQERLVYALRKSGNDAAAALVLLDELASGAPVTAGVRRALASVASSLPSRTAVADAIASIDDAGSPTRRARLVLARSASLPERAALALLERTIAEETTLSSPARRDLYGEGLSRFFADTSDERAATRALSWLGSVVRQKPGSSHDAALSLLRAADMPTDLCASVETAIKDPGTVQALAAEIALLHDDRERILAAIEAEPTGDTPIDLERRVRLASAVGAWPAADAAIAALSLHGDSPLLVTALGTAQRFGDAVRVARRIQDNEPDALTIDTLLERATLESITGDTAGALITLEAARDADPLDERVYAALLSLHGPNSPDPDIQAVAEIGRQIRAVLPESTILRQMIAGEMLRRRLTVEAARLIMPLFEEDPTDPNVLETVLNLWRARAASGDIAPNEIDLVAEIASERPNDAGLVRLLAGGHTLAGEADRAIGLIDAYENSTGDRSLAGLREQIIRDGLGDAPRADALALARLSPSPRSVDASVQLAALRAASDGSPAPILETLSAIPSGVELTGAQQGAALNAITRAAVAADALRRVPGGSGSVAIDDSEPMLALLDWALDRGIPLAPGIHELRLVMLAETDRGDDAVIEAAETAIDATGNTARAFTRRAVDLLVERGSVDRAFAWLADRSLVANESGTAELDSPAFQEWFRLVLITGDTDRGKSMIDRLDASDQLARAWDIARPPAADWTERDSADPAEMAYLLAVFAPDPDGSGAARQAYLRLALEYNPRHPWACNDLGYTMLESGHEEGGGLAEAERLIEIAYDAKPDQANIVDSLGWVRYHRGKLEDAIDPATGEMIPGAVTLLQQAVDLSEPDDDGVVHDHLGDAMYAAGRTEDAIEVWRTAARMANQALSRLRASGQAGGIRSDELAALAARAIMKPNALKMGEEPAIERQRGIEGRTDHQESPAGAGE